LGGTAHTRGGTEELIEVEETTGCATLVRLKEPEHSSASQVVSPLLANAGRARAVRFRVARDSGH